MGERGQASVEWVALLALVAVVLAALLAVAGGRLPGRSLGEAIARKIVCAVRASGSCARQDPLAAAYGDELAMLVRSYAPSLAYESGTRALPVDFRRCARDPGCADGPEGPGEVSRSLAGEPATAFVRVIDRSAAGGPLYIQYWLYYADSATGRGVPVVGEHGYHLDDWESYQVRIGDGGRAESRASSHNGYAYHGGARTWPSDLGVVHRSAWGPATGWLRVSGGSHAGQIVDGPGGERTTPAGHLRLVPVEPLTAGDHGPFAVSPPWRKAVYADPESRLT